MGRKGNWFSNVKKALSPDSKEKREEKSSKSKKKWFGKQKHHSDSDAAPAESVTLPPLPPQEEVKLTNVEVEQHNHENPVAVALTAVPKPAVIAPQAAPEVAQPPRVSRFVGKSGEEAAAIKIQTAFRGYLARRALRALRGLVRLKLLMEGSVVKRQGANTLKCMQTLARVQSQIRSRRIRMLEENQALQRQLLQKHAKELENLRLGEEWDDSIQSKEQIEASLLSKYEATMRRERALAYAFSHQQTLKNSSRSVNPMFMDPRNPTWGWSWLERWMAARPWESRGATDKDSNNDSSSVKSRSMSGGEINKSYARYLLNSEKLSSPTGSQKPSNSVFQSPSTPTKPISSTPSKKVKSASPRVGRVPDDDTRSMASLQSERFRRHSVGGATARDDESLASSPSLPSYMVPTESARAKSRMQSPFGAEKNGTPEKGPVESAKKRLSFPPSPAKARRHSGPPKVDTSSVASVTENSESNGIGG
ncbi:Protein IQ-DOMAIN 1 [Morus notabilis]|uniref:Protein IQ-DOMAIN 1 n=1 Tax=Morus notabilis TaxID=981085 RepID=W9S7W5_9ROSA|nr:protein IQ-DOMAIN 1 [Morus notabilis]XP_024028715.1 protein IQ-DOMAIN 1 [Morus notabilis]XP_024028716.1 protein IQ-DOMAIN 1 [Morus notabilis]XP_024028717.1 protein IQ-DOMAIN 1 [Morus notabilis]EXC16269.1 Protein IQ-DOMAIN 1 [Morus notabilis]